MTDAPTSFGGWICLGFFSIVAVAVAIRLAIEIIRGDWNDSD